MLRKSIIILVLSLLLTGCGAEDESENGSSENESGYTEETIIKIEDGDDNGYEGYEIYYDQETGVMYLWKYGYYKGGLTVMLNEDGTPKIYSSK